LTLCILDAIKNLQFASPSKGIDARKYDEMRVGEQLLESNMIVVRYDNAGLISLIKKTKG
jgi:hypothetical protein